MVSGSESSSPARELFSAALVAKAPVKYLSELRRVTDLVKDRAVAEALEAARMPAAEKVKLLSERAGGISPAVSTLVSGLLNRGQLIELENITTEYQRLLDAFHGVEGAEVAEVTTAVALDEDTKLSLGKRLTEIMGKPVVVKASVDPDVVGGIIVRVGDRLIDGSIRSRLQAISKELSV